MDTNRYAHLSIADATALLRELGLHPVSGGSHENDDGDTSGDGDDNADDAVKNGDAKPTVYATQADFEKAFRTRINAEKKRLTTELSESIKAELTQQLETDAAQKKGDLQKVIDDLKPKAESADALKRRLDVFEELAAARFDELLDSLPDAIRDLAPDDDADTLEKEKWLLTKAQPAVEKLRKAGLLGDDDDDARRPKRGLNPKDPPARGKDDKRTVKDIIGDYQASGQYQRLI